MTNRTTINVEKEAHRKAQEAKKDGETWSDYLLRSTDKDAVEKRDMDLDELEDRIVVRSAREYSSDLEQLEREIKKTQEIAEQARDSIATLESEIR